jgi:MFS family permease
VNPVSRQRTILVLAIAAQAAFSMVSFGLPAIGSDIRSEFGLGPAGFGAVYAAVGLGSAAALVPAGMLVDRFGARRILIAGGIVSATGTGLAGFAQDALPFGAALFVGGIGGAAVPVAGMTSLLREFPPEKRGIALGWRQLAVPLGGTIGSILLPALVALGGIRLAMLGAAAAALVTALWFATVAGDAPPEASMERGLGGLLAVPQMRLLLLLGLFYVSALGTVLAYYIPAARHAGLTTAEAAIGFTVLNVTAALSRIVWGRRADRSGGTRRLQTLRDTGLLATAAGLAIPAMFAWGAWAALPATVVLAFGVFGFNGVLYLVAGEIAGPERAGRAVGLASTVVFGWGSLVAPVAGLVIESTGYQAVWAISAVTTALGVVVALAMLQPSRLQPCPESTTSA